MWTWVTEIDRNVCKDNIINSASKSSIRRFVITEKAPTRAFSWLKAATTAFTFKTLLSHYAKWALTPRSLNVKLGPRHKNNKGRAVVGAFSVIVQPVVEPMDRFVALLLTPTPTTSLPLQYWLMHMLLPPSTKHNLFAGSAFNKV